MRELIEQRITECEERIKGYDRALAMHRQTLMDLQKQVEAVVSRRAEALVEIRTLRRLLEATDGTGTQEGIRDAGSVPSGGAASAGDDSGTGEGNSVRGAIGGCE